MSAKNPLIGHGSTDTLHNVSAVLELLKNVDPTTEMMDERASMGLYRILDAAQHALDYEAEGRKAERVTA